MEFSKGKYHKSDSMKILSIGNGILRSDNYPTPDVGGSVQTWVLCKELARRGHRIHIAHATFSRDASGR
jgi:UDP:flavonoid glycosyltransferase YjiC (YdhE family)